MSTKTSCPPFAWPDSASIFDLPMGRSPSLRSIRPCSATKRQPRADAKKAAAPKATAAAPKAAPKPAIEEQVIVDAIPAAPKMTRPDIKRNVKDKSKEDHFYYSNGGGIYLKLQNSNINIYDEEQGKVRQIRYCAGEPSIYVDEQSPSATRTQVIFRKNGLAVPYTKPNLREFLEAHPHNRKNGGGLFSQSNMV